MLEDLTLPPQELFLTHHTNVDVLAHAYKNRRTALGVPYGG